MKLYNAEAVVLRALDCGNGDKLMILFTKHQGKIKAMAHGVAKPSSRKRGAAQLFSHSKFLVNKGKELDYISQGELIEIFPYLRDNLERIAYASYWVELVDAITPEEEPNRQLFDLLLSTMHSFATGDGELLTRIFEMRIVSLLGYRPMLKQCANCYESVTGQITFSAKLGGVLCENCRKADPTALVLHRNVLEIMKLFLAWPPDKLSRLVISRAARNQIKLVQQTYIRHILEKDLKSADFAITFQEMPLHRENIVNRI